MLGRVTNYNKDRGFGFIRSLDNGETYFCHVSNIDDGILYRGYIVNFNPRIDDEKDRQYATNVQVVDSSCKWSNKCKRK